MATSYSRAAKNESPGSFLGFHSAQLTVGNAKQAADWYCLRFGFHHQAQRTLMHGEREWATYVVASTGPQGRVRIAFRSSLNPDNEEAGKFAQYYGDAVSDLLFEVENVDGIYATAVAAGAKSAAAPHDMTDEFGTVRVATLCTYGDVKHTLVQRGTYTGPYLPGYVPVKNHTDPAYGITAETGLIEIDHCVGNQGENQMMKVVEWYENCLKFHRFWSVDETVMHSQYSALRSVVMTDYDERIKMPINEPAPGLKKSQIQEFVDFNHGTGGVQHIALRTDNIIDTISKLRARGVEFLEVPDAYYTLLREKLAKAPIKVAEDLTKLQELKILVDYDDKGYLLQLFTKPVEDRPTLFFEIIQRANNSGFGVGNFKSLFEAIEAEQARRGNL